MLTDPAYAAIWLYRKKVSSNRMEEEKENDDNVSCIFKAHSGHYIRTDVYYRTGYGSQPTRYRVGHRNRILEIEEENE